MGYKALSTSRSAATTAVSRQATVINSPTGFAVAGSTITANTTISLNINTPGQAPNTTVAGLSISSVSYLNANNTISTANAVNTTGGNIKINGAGFTDPMTVVVGGTTISNANVTVANSAAIIAVLGSASPGNVNVYTFNASGTGAQLVNGVRYSGAPTWTTTSVSFVNNTAANVALVASSDSTLTYTLQAGSSLPTGISLISTGYLTGTPTGYTTTTNSTATIVATDAEGQATAQSISITVTAGDLQFNYTTLLLNQLTGNNRSNAATNNTFIDSSSNNYTITRVGNSTQGTYTPYSLSGWSNYFDGTGDALYTASSTALSLASSDFTIELWYNTSAKTNNYPVIISNGNFGSGKWQLDDRHSSDGPTKLIFGVYNAQNTPNWLVSTTEIQNGIWYHVAIVRSGSTFTMYLNGVAESTKTYSGAVDPGTAQTVYIGQDQGQAGTNYNGYISNVRLVKGTAVYTSAFTPPTSPLTAIANTSLLTCQNNRFIDNSTNNFTITKTGDTSVQAFTPFLPTTAYAESVNGGSVYFDGTGDYLSVTPTSALTIAGDFTVEFWVYFTALDTAERIPVNAWNTGQGWLISTQSNAWNWKSNGNFTLSYSAVAPVAGQWYHVAVSRIGSATNNVKMFINGAQVAQGTTTNTLSPSLGAGGLIIGAGQGGGGQLITGLVSGLRIVNGTGLYSGAFTPATTPPTAVANTAFLANFTNGAIVDAHATINLETVGNAQLRTTVTHFSNPTMYFATATDKLLVINNPNINLGLGDFTLECWAYFNVVNAEMTLINKGWQSASTAASYLIYMTNTGSLRFNASSNGSTFDISSEKEIGTMSAGVWTHIAVTRSGTTFRAFVNGTINNTFTFTSSATLANLAVQNLYIGGRVTASSSMNGYLDNVRITKGYARYTDSFTAPAAAFPGQ